MLKRTRSVYTCKLEARKYSRAIRRVSGGFRSLQANIKQQERKKFIIYSIYAWGSAMLLTGVCLIMDFVSSVPRNFIRPEFAVEGCWFTRVTVICNICLFVSTALKIIQHK